MTLKWHVQKPEKLLQNLLINNMKVGLFFGSFNPYHIGHKTIASYMIEFTDLEKVYFVVSPHNPLKKKVSLLDQHHRLMIIKRDIEDNPRLDVSDIEFKMKQPSYTIDTLVRMQELYPENKFAIIMGSDNFKTIHKWKNYKEILNNYLVYLYPRPKYSISNLKSPNVHIVDGVPEMEISASFIRKSIKNKKNVSYLIPNKAWKYIDEMNFYK